MTASRTSCGKAAGVAHFADIGAVKARFTGVPILRGAVQTVVLGGVDAGVACGLARLVSQFGA